MSNLWKALDDIMGRMPIKIVVVGGGTGSFAVLSGLKDRNCELSALVSMADDGGSTGMLRDDLGVLPPGDVRQCLVALSEAPQELRDLFAFRFAEGSLAGHAFGNLFLSAAQKMTDDFSAAVQLASDVLRVHGQVLPITLDNVRLAMSWDDGVSVKGEGTIDGIRFGKHAGLPSLHLDPPPRINPFACEAIIAADLVVVAPGDIYTSLGPLLVVDGVGNALRQTSARIIYVCNLVTKRGQTNELDVAGHASEIERFAGGSILDAILYNTAEPSAGMMQAYAAAGGHLVQAGEAAQGTHWKMVGRDLLSSSVATPGFGDPLAAQRSLIRHDPQKLADALLSLDIQS